MDFYLNLTEYQKFVRRKSSVQSYEKPVVLKASDNIVMLTLTWNKTEYIHFKSVSVINLE